MSMSACPRSRPGRFTMFSPAACLGVLGLAVLGGGCASESANSPSWLAGPIKVIAQALPEPDMPPQPKAAGTIRVEIEADGLPAQIAPRDRKPVADDPSEPWSPNYGKAATPAFDQQRVAAKLVAAQPASPMPIAVAAANAKPLNADDVIRQAIANHEMRRSD